MSKQQDANMDHDVVAGFGAHWSRVTQEALSDADRSEMFEGYFRIFPWNRLPSDGGVGADVGCGTGRWGTLVAPRVTTLHLVDASAEALDVARRNLAIYANARFHCASVADLPFEDCSLDFAYSLGVLHHVPDTRRAIASTARKLKPGAPLLLYLYYAFDNRPRWYGWLWKTVNPLRLVLSRMPFFVRNAVSYAIAAGVYWPIARTGALLRRLGQRPAHWPLQYYGDKAFYVMRTDSLDRFGTRLEQRFTRDQIREMMHAAGLRDIRFSDAAPFWCAVGFKDRGGTGE